MSDLTTERGAAIELTIDEYKRLQRHDPDNSLLKYTRLSDDGLEFNKDMVEQFLDQYAKDNPPVAVMIGRYFVDLRKEVDKIEGIDRTPEAPKRVPYVPYSFDKDDKLPF